MTHAPTIGAVLVSLVALWLAAPASKGDATPSGARSLAEDVAEPAPSPEIVTSREIVNVEPAPAEVTEAPAPAPPVAVSPLPDGFRPGSGYGWRTSPRTGARRFHAGLDFLAPRGTPVRAVHAGVVERVARDVRSSNRFAGYGNAVVVRHPELGRWSFYAHLDEVSVEAGDTVEAGALVGAVGSTTNGRFRGMAAHLHFEVRHARDDGRSPFPGAYRQFNDDPHAWLGDLGVTFEADARGRRARPARAARHAHRHPHADHGWETFEADPQVGY